MRKLTRFFNDTSGNVAIMTILVAVPLLGAVGAALDYSEISRERSQIQNAADAAILAGVREAQRLLVDGFGPGKAKIDGQKTADDFFKVNSAGRGLEINGNFVPTITISAGSVEGTGDFTGTKATNILGLIGYPEIDIALNASARISPPQFTEIHFMIDVSASMGIGATLAEIQKMEAETTMQCGFACHAPAGSVWTDTLATARTIGATLMIDVARDSVTQIMDQLEAQNLGSTVTVGVHTFSNNIETLIAPTSNFGDVKNSIANMEITGKEGQGGTSFRRVLQQLESEVGMSGDGSSTESRKQIVVLVTDGVATNTLYELGTLNQWGWVDDFGEDPNFDAYQLGIGNGDIWSIGNFDPNNCSRLKNINNVEIYAIGIEYNTIQNPWDPNDLARVGIVEQYVKPYVHANLSSCATSPGNAFRADDGPELKEAFDDVIKKIFGDDLRVTG